MLYDTERGISMALDGITTAALAAQLRSTLTGGRIARITQPDACTLLLTVKAPGSGQQKLLLSADPSLPLLYLTQEGKPGPAEAPAFLMLLRKHLAGARITAVEQPGLERIVRITAEHLDELGDRRQKTLVLEMMGKHSNLILLSEDGTVIDSIRRVPPGMSSVREVLPGRPYFVPNTRDKADPLTLTRKGLTERFTGSFAPLEKALNEQLTGISPLMAREICERAGLRGDETAGELTDEETARLADTLADLTETVRSEAYAPCLYRRRGKLLEFSALPLAIYAGEECEPCESMSRAVESFYAEKSSASRIRQRSSDLRHILQLALERTSRKLDLQRKQWKDTEKKEKYRLWGELLRTYGYGAEPGAREITVPNHYDNDTPVTIPLDETLSAGENATRYYDRYRKLKRTADATAEQIVLSENELVYLRSVSSALALAETEEDLAGIKAELTETGYIRAQKRGKKEKAPKTGSPLHYRSPEGFDLYVGRNNLQNDELTFSFASGSDWWFHVKGIPGSHVIVKTGGRELSDRGFEQAAALAAWYSDAPREGKTEVDYTRRRELKKPAGAHPGMVIYHTNYSLVTMPSLDGLEIVKQ